MSLDRLIKGIKEMNNPTVAGLDPKLDYIPEYIKQAAYEKYGKTLEGAAEALFEFNKGLIDALCDIVPAVKPQAAYYEMYGWQGVRALERTIAYAKSKGMFVITDGKRNDIGTTMEAYAKAHLGNTDVEGESFEAFGGDALTVNGYLGTDGVKPVINVCKEK
ncbi:MAG: orotidine-5'-phosphate decarboxylase, partial [Clostridia bacterium]|nr:orotidine-5'-phosphate decarboxylase [Clostridia bacterium]